MRAPIALMFCLAAAPALADDDKPRLAYGIDASTTVSVTWNRAGDAPGFVEYRVDGAAEWVRAESTPIPWPEWQRTIHSTWLQGLQPDTRYDYRVGDGQAWSDAYRFRTGPADGCTPYTFVALGDDRSQDDFGPSLNFGPILAESLETAPAFILNGGDLVEEGNSPEQWFNWLDHTGELLSQVPQMPTIGNHDDDRVDGEMAFYNRLFTLPRNAANELEDFYYFTFGDLIVVSLSSTTFRDDGWAMQAAWLDEVLTENPRRWKIVMLHHPFYTSTLLGLVHEPDEVGQNAPIVPVLDRHHVDLVLQSHNHWYQRFEPSFGGVGDEPMTVDDPADGTVYVTTGGAGAFTVDVNELFGVLDIECGITEGCAVLRGEHHYIEFEMQPNMLLATVHATAAQNFGMSPDNREVIDQFAIEKAGDERIECDAPPPPVEPDAAVAPPADAAVPAPDMAAAPDPDMALAPDPDAAAPVADSARPQPDVTPLAPDAATAVADARPRRLPRDAEVSADAPADDSGCGCGATPTPALLMLLLAGRRRRRR